MKSSTLYPALTLALLAGPLATAAQEGAGGRQDPESVELDTLEVRVLPQGGSALDATQPVEVLVGEALDDKKEATLGETLQSEVGIHSTYFGPGAGRPVIRGLGGSRVRITEDGLNSLDASALSPDHAISIEPLLIDRIEILRGPANLLYGSTASAGVVNVIDNRIPEQRQAFSGAVELRGNTAADERAGVFRLDGGLGALQFHVDGFKRETDDYELPAFALSPEQRAELDADESAELRRGVLENSFQESEGGTAGLSVVGDWGYAGLAYKRYETLYGIPGGHAHEEGHDEDHEEGHAVVLEEDGHDAHGEEGVSIDLEQERWEFKSALMRPVDAIKEITFKLVSNDYTHVELEGNEVGTTFDVEGIEFRSEARLASFGRHSGVGGVQYEDTDLEAIGSEAFIPPAKTESLGVFYVHELDFDAIQYSAGVRLQQDEVSLTGGNTMGALGRREFSLLTVSAGAVRELGGDWQATFNWQRSERAPTQEELFAGGPHVATRAFEIGDPTLEKEVSSNIDFGLHGRIGPLHLRADVFYNNIDDFVFLANTPDTADGLPVQRWSQADASFWGIEAEASYLADFGHAGDVEIRLFADSVEAEVDAGNGEIPRLSPARAGTGLDWHRGNWRANVSYYRVFEKNDVAGFETATSGYDMLSANAVYSLPLARADVELFVKGNNLLDQTQRVHTSFLKEFAPMPGLNVTGGVRLRF